MPTTQTLRDLLDDLHKLEINTIEKTVMTAQKMPPPLLAIFEVVESYESYFDWTLARRTYNYTVASETKTAQTLKERLEYSFANAAMRFNLLATEVTDEGRTDRLICGRIGRNCEYLLGLLRRADEANEAMPRDGSTGRIAPMFREITASALRAESPDAVAAAWRLSSGDMAYLRKIWEIMTEKVLIQTVVQIEGDVITRISPLIADEKRRHLLDVHKDGIETSLKMWGELVSVAGRIVETAGRAVGRLLGA